MTTYTVYEFKTAQDFFTFMSRAGGSKDVVIQRLDGFGSQQLSTLLNTSFAGRVLKYEEEIIIRPNLTGVFKDCVAQVKVAFTTEVIFGLAVCGVEPRDFGVTDSNQFLKATAQAARRYVLPLPSVEDALKGLSYNVYDVGVDIAKQSEGVDRKDEEHLERIVYGQVLGAEITGKELFDKLSVLVDPSLYKRLRELCDQRAQEHNNNLERAR